MDIWIVDPVSKEGCGADVLEEAESVIRQYRASLKRPSWVVVMMLKGFGQGLYDVLEERGYPVVKGYVSGPGVYVARLSELKEEGENVGDYEGRLAALERKVGELERDAMWTRPMTR